AGSWSTGGVRAPWMALVAKPGRRSSSLTDTSGRPALGVAGPEVPHQARQLRHHVVGHGPEHRRIVLPIVVLREIQRRPGLHPHRPAELHAALPVLLPHVL